MNIYFIKERECLAQLCTREMNYFVHCDQTINNKKIEFNVDDDLRKFLANYLKSKYNSIELKTKQI